MIGEAIKPQVGPQKPTKPPTQATAIQHTAWPQKEVAKFKEHGCWQDKTLLHYFLISAERHPERLAIVSPQAIRYRELKDQVLFIADKLRSRGIGPQDTVVLQLPNCPAFIQYLLAIFAVGAVPVMALPAHRGKELNYLLSSSAAKAFIAMKNPSGGYGGFQSIKHIDWPCVLIAADDDIALTYLPISRHNTIEPIPLSNIDPHSVALLQLSGGTTGLPKLIPRTHNDYAYSVITSNRICEVDEASVFLCILPAAHNFTLSSPGILGTLFAGGALVLADRLSADEAFASINKWGVTHAALVPPLALSWLNYHRINQRSDKPLAQLTSLLVGGAKLSATSARALIEELGAPLQQVFGMAEGLVNYTRLTDSLEKRCSTQGKPMSELDEVLVVDDEDQPVNIGQIGHLLSKGPYTIRAYLNAPEANKKSFTESGFYRTGDIVSLDADGYITVEGREKDQINRGGEKISAAELENYLLGHPKILDAAVIAINDEYLGERTAAYLVTDANATISLVQCREYLRQYDIADFKLPDKVFCVDQLPKTPFGKVSKKTLRDMANTPSPA